MWDSNLKISVCRTCLVKVTQTTVFHVFNTDDLAKKLMLCSSLPLEASDEYPENVCHQCYEKILIFYDFQEMCAKSLDTLNEWLKTKSVLQEVGGQCDGLHKNETTKDPLRDKNFENFFDNMEIKNKKRGRPPKNKIKELQLERNTVIKKSRRSDEEKFQIVANNCTVKGKIKQNLEEHLQFDEEKLDKEENISKKEKFNDHFSKQLKETGFPPVISKENKEKEKVVYL